MKKILFPIVLILFAAGCGQSGEKAEENSQEIEIAAENLVQVSLKVKGMTCEGCENAIVTSINKLEGIQEAAASHKEENAVVSFDSGKTDVEAISQAITSAGYEVIDKDL